MKTRNLKRLLATMLAGAMMAALLAGCGSTSADTTAEESTEAAEETTETTEAAEEDTEAAAEESTDAAAAEGDYAAFDAIEFPDAMPSNPTLAEDDYYDYDDMSKSYDITLFTYNYGQEPPEDDPIEAWLEEKYNVNITLLTATSDDMQTVLSTSFSSGDAPDLVTMPDKDFAFTLAEQGLLVDAREMYPYMPQTCKFVTNTLISYTTMSDGTIPVVTKYAIQDSDIWSYAIRTDWLETFGMEMPTTKEELLAYAKACTFDDPDGNGVDDTWFMTGAGGGSSFGMLSNFINFFGCPDTRAEDGVLVHPMFDGTTKEWLEFLNELYEAGVLAPDWFTIEWENAKSYTLQDKIGMLHYPSGSLYDEYVKAHDLDYTTSSVWKFLEQAPIEGEGNWVAGGKAGLLFGIPAANVEGDEGKLMRICHILDAMCYGGEAYFQTVQGGGLDVYPDYDGDVRQYNDDGTSYCYVSPEHPGYTIYGTDRLNLDTWQNFGYTLKWQLYYSDDEEVQLMNDYINEGIATMNTYPRWENYSLLYSIDAGIAPNLSEFEIAQEYKFVTGERSFDEWDTYVQEWLDKGGREQLAAIAESLGCEVPAEMQ